MGDEFIRRPLGGIALEHGPYRSAAGLRRPVGRPDRDHRRALRRNLTPDHHPRRDRPPNHLTRTSSPSIRNHQTILKAAKAARRMLPLNDRADPMEHWAGPMRPNVPSVRWTARPAGGWLGWRVRWFSMGRPGMERLRAEGNDPGGTVREQPVGPGITGPQFRPPRPLNPRG